MTSRVNFNAPLDRFIQELGINREIAVRKIAVDLLTKVVKRTPVDTGRARSGWDLTISTPSTRQQEEIPGTVPGQHDGHGAQFDTMTQNSGAISEIDGTKMIYIINNVEYIEALENGHSQQAPAGMVIISMDEEEAEIELTLQRLLNGRGGAA